MEFGTFALELQRLEHELADVKCALRDRDEAHQRSLDEMMSVCSAVQHRQRLVSQERADALAAESEASRTAVAILEQKLATLHSDSDLKSKLADRTADAKRHKSELQAARADAARYKREAEDEASMAAILRDKLQAELARASQAEKDVAALTEINSQLGAEIGGLRGAIEQMVRQNQRVGAEYLSLVLLRPSFRALREYTDVKMLAIRGARSGAEIQAELDAYFDTTEAADYVDARVRAARESLGPGFKKCDIMASVLAELTGKGG